jgi:L-fuculose-phosphate aldolase
LSQKGKSDIEELVETAHRLYREGYLRGREGNLSCRRENGNVLISPTSRCKGELTPDDLVEVNPEGERVSGNHSPSSDVRLHLFIYKHRPDVNACLHAHPVYATVFSVLGEKEKIMALPEMEIVLGEIAFLDYTPPETKEVPKAMEKLLQTSNAFILTRHGALTLGGSFEEAFYRMETLERCAQVAFLSNLYLKARPPSGKIDFLD